MVFIKHWILIIIVYSYNVLICESKVFLRKNVNSFTHKEWEDLKRGIQVMKERNFRNRYDPLGYYYQANIHGWPEYDATEKANQIAAKMNWHQCQHASYFFLVWHRMYIYFFERILREASGNPTLSLPYWDYFDANSRSLPQSFRIPANNKTNPLYVSQRCKNINEGNPFSEKIVNPYPALSTNFFSTFKQNNELNLCHSFGGGKLDKPTFLSDREGLLERIPHDNVHLFVGGPMGYMSDLCRSSRDPVFYIHHSQTDRIWESWIHAGGKNLMEAKYLNQTFDFFDETGRLNSYGVGDFLYAKDLGYKYESLITAYGIEPTRSVSPNLYVPIDETQNLNINYHKRVLTFEMEPQWNVFFNKFGAGRFDRFDVKFTLQFDVDHLESDVIFEIYLNLNPETIPSDSHPNFLGTMVTFRGHCVPGSERDKLSISKCYDISDQLKVILKNEYNINGFVSKYLNLTFVPKFCDQIFYPKNEKDLIKFNEALIVFYRVDESYLMSLSNVTENIEENIKKDKEWQQELQLIIPGIKPRT